MRVRAARVDLHNYNDRREEIIIGSSRRLCVCVCVCVCVFAEVRREGSVYIYVRAGFFEESKRILGSG